MENTHTGRHKSLLINNYIKWIIYSSQQAETGRIDLKNMIQLYAILQATQTDSDLDS